MSFRFLPGSRLDGFNQVYDALVGSVEKYGIKGLKGFFYAICKKEDNLTQGRRSVTLEINPEVVLPPEKW